MKHVASGLLVQEKKLASRMDCGEILYYWKEEVKLLVYEKENTFCLHREQ